MNIKFVKLVSILLLVFVFCGCVAAADIEVSDCDGSAVSDSMTTISVHDNEDGTKSLTIYNNKNNSNEINSVSDGGDGTPIPHVHVYTNDSDMNETPHDQFVNESFTFNIDFSNVGDAVGYQPIIELVVPKELSINDFSFLGTHITMTEMGTFTLNNMYTVKDNFTNKTITLNASYEDAVLYVIHLPLGSYTPQEPATSVRMSMYLKGDIPLNLTNMLVTPIFRYGAGYIDDPDKFPPIYNETIMASVQPEIVRVDKTDDAPKKERSTGPNFNYTYTVNVDIANGKDINNVVINDNIPTQLVYAGDLHVYYHGQELIKGQDYEIVNLPSSNRTGGNLKLKFLGNFTGDENAADITLNYVVWAPRFDNSTTNKSQHIINPGTGDVNVTNNTVNVTCDYNSTYGNYSFDLNASDNVTLKALAIQKDVLVNGSSVAGGTVSVGDNLTYVINFQVSDYFSLTDFVLNDTPLHVGLGAGQVFIEDSVRMNLMGTEYIIPSTYYSVSPERTSEGGDFTYFRVIVRISDFLREHEGIENLTGSLNISDTLGAAVVGNVRFNVLVTAFYENGTNETSVSSQDTIINDVIMESKLTSNKHDVSDTSATSCLIRPPSISKYIYAVNGNTSRNSSDINNKVKINPGDNVTFLLDAYIVNSVDGFNLTDYLPTPLFNITDFVTTNSTKGIIPLVNHWAYANDSEIPYNKEGNEIIPLVRVNPDPNNELYFAYGNIFDEDHMFHLKIMITVEASNAQFADELYLTNLVGITYQDSLNQTYHNETIVGFILNEPELNIIKEVKLLENIYSDGGFQGDTIAQYTVNVTNIGHFQAYDVIVCDDYLELGVGEVLDLTFIYGNGTVVNLTQEEINDFFNTSKGYSVGNLPWKGEKGTDCNNFVIIYTVKFNEKTQPKGRVINTANITNFASINDGPNFATNQRKYSDNATVIAAGVKMDKTFVGSEDYGPDFELNITEGRKDNLTVGELGVFNLTITIPNLNFTELSITDVIDDYLEIPMKPDDPTQPMVRIICSDDETNTHLDGDFATNWNSNTHTLTIDCGNSIFVPVNGTNVTHEITFLIYYVAVDKNGIKNTHEKVVNHANFTLHTGYTFFNETTNTTYEVVEYIYAEADVDVYQPNLTISKNYNTSIVSAGEAVNFNITVKNIGKSPSFNTTIVDDLSNLIENFTLDGYGGINWTFDGNSTPVNVTWDGKVVSFDFHRLNPGESISVKGEFIVKKEVIIGMEDLNIGIATGNSTPENRHEQTRLYLVSDNDTIITKNLTINKTVLNSTIANGKTNATIGENVTYNMTITVVEGFYPYLKFNDTLPTGFRYVNESIVIICDGTQLNNTSPNGTIWYNITIGDNGRIIVIDFNNDFAQYVINHGGLFNVYLNATVLNATSNKNGTTKTNVVEFHWFNHMDNDTADVLVVEPVVNIVKKFNVTTNVSGGDDLSFNITVKNTGKTPLFNVTIIDDLSELAEKFIDMDSIDNVWIVTGEDWDDANYTIDENNVLFIFADSINPGDSKTFVVEFTVRTDVPVGYVYTNVANVTGYSVPVDGTDNDTNRLYTKNSTSSVDTKNLTINKTVYNSTIDNGLTNATIGENVTYEMNVTVVTGNYTHLNITDYLPEGFRYVDGSVVIKCNNVVIQSPDMYNITVVDNKVITITFTNEFAQEVIANGGIFKVYLNATVLNVTSNNASLSTKNRTKTNVVVLEWNNGHKDNDTANVLIVEPVVNINKKFNVTTNVSGGDNLSFNITVKNTGNTPLFNVTIIDDLSELAEKFIDMDSIDNVWIVTGEDWDDANYTIDENNVLFIFADSINPGDSKTFVVEFTVRTDVPVGYVYTNVANVTGYSVPVDGTDNLTNRLYAHLDDDSVNMANVTINKTVYNSTIPNGKNNVTIGENVTYNITVTLVKGNYTILNLTDDLPKTLEYINNSIVVMCGDEIINENYTVDVINGQKVVISFTNDFAQYVVENNDGVFTVFLDAIRLNNTSSAIQNNATIVWNNRSAKSMVNITLVEPDVKITKEFNQTTDVKGKDVISFIINVTNNGSSPLFNTTVVDDLSALISGYIIDGDYSNIRITYADGSYVPEGVISWNGNVLTLNIGELGYLNNTSVAFKLTFTVKDDVIIGSKYTNVANVTGYSAPFNGTDDDHNRVYSRLANDSFVTDKPSITKEVLDGITNVTIGENVTYVLNVTAPIGLYKNLTIVDILPDGFKFNSAVLGNGTEVTPIKDCTFEFINYQSLGANLIIYVTVDVVNNASNHRGDIKNNIVKLYSNGTFCNNDTANVTIVEPVITIEKVATEHKFNVTESVQYNITVKNTGTAPAYFVNITDVLNETLVFDHCDSVEGWTINYDEATRTLSMYNPYLAEGSSVTFVVICNFTEGALGKNITNVANVTAKSVNDPDKGRNYTNSSNDTVYVVVVDVEVTKICTSDVVAGQNVTYDINVTNHGPDTAYNVILQEIFDSSKLCNVSYKIIRGDYDGQTGSINTNDNISLGNFVADQTVIIQIKGLLKSDALGILNNTVKVTTETNESDYTNNNDTNLTNIVTRTEIDVLKVSNETEVIRGNNISYVINVTIKGPSDARNVTLWDTFDTTVLLNMEYSLDNKTWNNYTNNTIISLGNISAGDFILVFFRANVNPETHIEIANNTVNITTVTDHNGTNTSNNVTPIKVVADINITKVANVTDVNPEELVAYTINVSASGISYSTNVTLTDILNTTYLDGSNAKYSVDGVEKGSWTGTVYLGTMTPGQSIIVVIHDIKVKDVPEYNINNTIPNVANVTSYEVPEGRIDDANITVNLVDVAVEKNMTTGNYRDNITFTINVTNNGPNSTSNVTVKDLLPTYLIYQNHTASNGNEKYNPLTGIWTIGDIAVGQVFTLTITCTINKTGFIENNVTVETYTGHDTNMSNNNDTVNDTVPLAIDLAIDKVVDSYGNYTENITYNITVINNGPDNGTGIFVIDKLPKGIYFLEANNTNVVDNGDGTFTWTIGNLTVGESVSIQVICSINTTGNVTNYANVTGNEYDWNLTNNYDNVTVEIPPAIDLAIIKDVVEFGNYTENITYVIIVTNNGPNNATGVIVNDLPDGVLFLNATEGAEIIDNGDGTFSWVIGDLNVGEYVYIYVTCSINATGNVTNFVNVSGNEFEWNWTNNYDNVTVEIPPAIDLAVDKEVESYGNYTGNIVYTIVVTNNGPNDATGVVVIDELPKGIIFVSADSSNVVDNGDGTFTWTIGDLASSDSILLTVTCLINTTGNVTNFVNVSGNEYEWNWTNNYDNVTVEIPPAADLAVNKTANIRNVTVGDKVVYTIVVWNNGPDTAPNAYAIDKLPEGLKFVSYKASVGSYNPVTGIWTIGDLPVGKSVTLIITTIATKSGIIDNVVTVGSDAFDVNESNNIANYTIEVKDVQNSNTNLISMERTGAPLFALVLVILLFAIGITTRSRWRK